MVTHSHAFFQAAYHNEGHGGALEPIPAPDGETPWTGRHTDKTHSHQGAIYHLCSPGVSLDWVETGSAGTWKLHTERTPAALVRASSQ